jgi:hypothetical protein
MVRRGLLVLLGLALALTATVAVAEEQGQACPPADRKVEMLDNGVRCTVLVKAGGDVAALRAHVRECAGKCKAEGASVAFEEVEGGLVVTHTATDAAAVKALQSKAQSCASGAGCTGHDESAKGCPHHKGEAKDAAHEGCTHHKGAAKT